MRRPPGHLTPGGLATAREYLPRKTPQPRRVVQQIRQRPVLQAAGSGQVNRGSSSRHTSRPAWRRRLQSAGASGLSDVRTAGLSKVDGQLRRQTQRGGWANSPRFTAPGVIAEQHAGRIFLLRNLVLSGGICAARVDRSSESACISSRREYTRFQTDVWPGATRLPPDVSVCWVTRSCSSSDSSVT